MLLILIVLIIMSVAAVPALADHEPIHIVHTIIPGKAMGTAELGMTLAKIQASGTLCAISGARFDAAGKAVWLQTNTGGVCRTEPGDIQVAVHGAKDVVRVFGKPNQRVEAERYPHATAFWYRYNRGIEFYVVEWRQSGILNTQITAIAVFPAKK